MSHARANASSVGMGGRRRVLRSRAQRYFASQNANQRRSPRPMAIVVQMTCPFVDTETVQPRYLGWSTHNIGNCGRPIDQTYSAAGELTVHSQKQAGPRGGCRTIGGRQRYVANCIEEPNAMSLRALRHIVQEPRSGRPEQFRTMVTPKVEHGL